MTTVTLWILLAVSSGYYNRGTPVVIGKFSTLEACEFVQRNIPSQEVSSRCIQATIIN